MTWLDAVAQVRSLCEGERWRLTQLRSLEGWREFVVAWEGAGGSLKGFAAGARRDTELASFDEKLVWTWEVVDEAVDAVLLVLSERCVLSGHDIVAHFETIRGAGLIFADGSTHKLVRERLDREQTAIDTRESAKMFEASLQVAMRQRRLNKLLGGNQP